jgi:aspartate/methionine/tyrosine aminotransferase
LRESFNENPNFLNISNKYAESKGSYYLRNEIAARYRRNYGAKIDPEKEIIVTHGAAEAIWLTILVLTSIGDEVLIPDPSYTLYETVVKFLGRVPVKIPVSRDSSCLSLKSIQDNLSGTTKLLMINSPENPTGAIYSKELIKDIHDLAKQNGFYFVHDEVYDSYVFDGIHNNLFRHQHSTGGKFALINSFSKRYSMMGWRLGWVISNRDVIDGITKVHTNLTLNLGSFHQDAAASLLNDMEVEKEVQARVLQVARNVEIIAKALLQSNVFELPFGAPKGGLFLFPNISKFYEHIPDNFKAFRTKGESVMEYLLEVYKVAVVPGYIYGSNSSDFIRIVAAVHPEVAKEAADRFIRISSSIKALV